MAPIETYHPQAAATRLALRQSGEASFGKSLDGGSIQVVYGDPEEVIEQMGEQTAYIERTHLTSRQMNGRLVRKTLSYSKRVEPCKRLSPGKIGSTT